MVVASRVAAKLQASFPAVERGGASCENEPNRSSQAAGVPDVLLTNEVVGADKVARVVAATEAGSTVVGILVDDVAQVEAFDAALSGVVLDCYVEVDVGQNRCGVAGGAATAHRRFRRCPSLGRHTS